MTRSGAALLLLFVLSGSLAVTARALAQAAFDGPGEATAVEEAAPAEEGDASTAGLDHLEHPPELTWAPDVERGCERRAGMRYASCDGPRRVVEPTDEARARAARLGLGTHATADELWTGSPRPEWVAEAGERHEGLLWPVAAGLFSRGFGAARVHDHVEGSHRGLDVVAAEGAHLRAVDDALVAYADNGVRGLGNVLFLVLGDGTTVIYAHCRSILVAAGERVRRGELVGTLGRTGLTVRAHLHLEWRREGEPRDPMPEMRERPDWRIREEDGGEVTWLAVPPNRLEPAAPVVEVTTASDAGPSDAARPSDAGPGEAKTDVSPPAPPPIILSCACPLGDDDGETDEADSR